MVLLLTCQLLQAREAFNGATPASDWAPIELTLTDSRYSLASIDHSSGFVPAPKHLILKDAFDRQEEKPCRKAPALACPLSAISPIFWVIRSHWHQHPVVEAGSR